MTRNSPDLPPTDAEREPVGESAGNASGKGRDPSLDDRQPGEESDAEDCTAHDRAS